MAKRKSSENNVTNSTNGQEIAQDGNSTLPKDSNGKRHPLPQVDMPSYSIDEALRIPRVIGDYYAFRPTRPLDIAAALDVQPTSSGFRMLISAATAYGLTEGSYNASFISVTPLARRILEPQDDDDELQARRQAFLRPRIAKEFLTRYDGNKFPPDAIAKNVLSTMGVPEKAVDRTLKLIIDGAKQANFLLDIKGISRVDLQGTSRSSHNLRADVASQESEIYETPPGEPDAILNLRNVNQPMFQQVDNKRVFITHGKNKSFIEPLKELLVFGELEPIVSVERESVSQSISEKVLDDMRNCGTAMIHIEDEQKLIDSDGNEHIILNPNVLIEIGAAMALYDKKFILLVKSGITLPSNLQGLYEVRYEGEKLDFETTIRLLKAIKDIKKPSSSAALI